jgi:hypothetical protein
MLVSLSGHCSAVSLPTQFIRCRTFLGLGSLFEGAEGVRGMKKFPYALPNLLFSFILGMAALAGILGLDETHPDLRHRRDCGRQLGKHIIPKILRDRTSEHFYHRLLDNNSAGPKDRPLANDPEDTQHSRPMKARDHGFVPS